MSKKKGNDYLLLKWGTVKGWEIESEKALALLRQFFKDGVPMSCMTDHPDKEHKRILCELIDAIDGKIQNDWDGKFYSKAKAKEYVLNYGANP